MCNKFCHPHISCNDVLIILLPGANIYLQLTVSVPLISVLANALHAPINSCDLYNSPLQVAVVIFIPTNRVAEPHANIY